MHVQLQPTIPVGGTAAANTQVQVVIPGAAGRRIMLTDCQFSFSGAASAAPVRATVTDGTTTLGYGVTALTDINPHNPLAFAPGANVTITLPAGGASAVGDISAAYYTALASEA